MGGTDEVALARYNPDGSVDAGFGMGGKVLTASGAADAEVGSLLLQPDNKLLVAGTAGPSGGVDTQFILARYNADGSIDRLFGQGGVVGVLTAERHAALQDDDRLGEVGA